MPDSAADGACAPAVGPAMMASDSAVNPRSLIGLLSFGAGELHRLAQEPAVQPGAIRVVTQSTLAEPAHGDRVDAVLLGLHARRQARLVVVRRHGNARLDDPRATVQSFGYEMHRCAVLGVASLQSAPVRVQPRILGQQRWVDVQYFSGKVLHELRGQDAHESGEYDQGRRVDLDRGGQGAIVGGAIRLGRGQSLRWNAETSRQIEPGGIGLVRKHPAYRIGRAGFTALLDESTHIAAASRDQDDDLPPRQRTLHAMMTPRVPARTSPMMSASWPNSRRMAMARSALQARR